ncbi:MAG TPA: carboxypeptidase-like regulatory domain-containing protein, partial [Bryobacteraceae bacterium]
MSLSACRLVSSIAVALLCAGAAYAQESRATLSGTVTDPSGSVIPGTDVKLVNSRTGIAFDTKTNEAGQYRFLFLNPGMYRLTVQSTGFRVFVRENITLQVNLATVIDVALQLGDLSDRVTVTSEAPLLEAEKGDRGLVLNNK